MAISGLHGKVVLCAVSSMCAAAFAQPTLVLDYVAARGTIPTQQCWTQSGVTSPAPTVVNDELHMGPTGTSATQLFEHVLLFNFLRDHVVCEWDLQVVSSGYGANSCGTGQRAGWYTTVTDTAGHLVYCGVGANTVFLTNNSGAFVGTNAPATTQVMTDQFHAFRREIDSPGVRLAIDGTPRLSMPLGSTGVASQSIAGFGDLSVCQGSQTRLHRFSITLPPQCGVDFNRDCVADFFDYLDFVDAFAALRPDADFNQDGVIDFFDYLDFVDLMSRNC